MNPATISKTELTTDNILSISFVTDIKLAYEAGQFLEITLPHQNSDSRGATRKFTLASSPSDEENKIITKLPPEPSSFKKALAKLRVGDKLTVSDTIGDFVLPINHSIPLVFIAAGIGITPVVSILRYVSHHKINLNVKIYHIVGKEKTSYEKITGGYKAKISYLSRIDLNPDFYIKLSSLDNSPLFYISGPDDFVYSVKSSMQQNNIDDQRIVTDSFLGY